MPNRPPEPIERPRRFYTAAAAMAVEGGFAVTLDGRVAKTPAGGRLVAPSLALAELIAAEWGAQGETIDLAGMLATRLAATALDGDEASRASLVGEVARYAASDLLCYFAEAPQALLAEEVTHWTPVLDWAERDLGLRFVRVTGVMHRPQPPETVEGVQRFAEALDPFALAGVAFGVGLFGSAILGLAVERGQLSGDAAFTLSRLDEAYQEARWGVDEAAAERTGSLRQAAEQLQAWFTALRSA